jgi:putative two-component system response regulator
MVEAKDAYDEEHLWRLHAYSEQLALACGLKYNQVRAIRYGSILHDIGKIGVSETILRKPGQLLPEEIKQIKMHPELGARIVSRTHFARDVVPIIHAHHEHWDGNGYPNRLRGEQIPIGARIIAIVEAFAAMTSDRPYGHTLSTEEAVSKLRTRRGTQYDPQVLDTFLRLIESGRLVAPGRVRAQGDSG